MYGILWNSCKKRVRKWREKENNELKYNDAIAEVDPGGWRNPVETRNHITSI